MNRRPAHSSAPVTASHEASGGCASGLDQHEILDEVLAATCWLESADHGKPYSASIRFFGRRTGVSGKPQPGDRFEQVVTVDGIIPGSGLVSITTHVSGVNPGEWVTTAEPVVRGSRGRMLRVSQRHGHDDAPRVRRLLWFWGKPAIAAGVATHTRTRLLPFVSAPGIIPGAWPALVGLGVLVGMAVQAALVARERLDVWPALVVSLSAALAGLVGAKLWFLAQRRGPATALISQGLCIQGFITGATLVWAAALALFHLPVGLYLDAAAPGLLVGMAIGRPGCFFAGCCVGRPTASRWGVWASDGRIGIRRIPTQLLESLASLALGTATLLLFLLHQPALPGALFVGAVAGYTLSRQLLLPFRAEPRRSRLGRPLAMAAAGAGLVTTVLAHVG